MSSHELTSEEKMSFSVLQQTFNPKLNKSRVCKCGFPNNLSEY